MRGFKRFCPINHAHQFIVVRNDLRKELKLSIGQYCIVSLINRQDLRNKFQSANSEKYQLRQAGCIYMDTSPFNVDWIASILGFAYSTIKTHIYAMEKKRIIEKSTDGYILSPYIAQILKRPFIPEKEKFIVIDFTLLHYLELTPERYCILDFIYGSNPKEVKEININELAKLLYIDRKTVQNFLKVSDVFFQFKDGKQYLIDEVKLRFEESGEWLKAKDLKFFC